MIVRVWRGTVHASKAEKYAKFLQERAVPDYASVPGLKKLLFLRNQEDENAHFLLISFWNSIQAVIDFAGVLPELAKYYPEDEEFLLEKDEKSHMYEIFYESGVL